MNNVLRPIFQQTLGLLSGHRVSGKLLVLTFHRVLENFDNYVDELDAVQFTQQMETLCEYFNVVSLEQGLEQLKSGDIAPGSVAITFDDGYRDNFDVALPILQALDLPATFFIACGYLGNGMMWNDIVTESIRVIDSSEIDLTDLGCGKATIKSDQQKMALINKIIGCWRNKTLKERDDLANKLCDIAQFDLKEYLSSQRIMMTEEEVKQLSQAGMEIGGHTVNHPILASSDVDEARKEIEVGKSYLENMIAKELKYFAYPSGRFGKDYKKIHAGIVRQAGFDAAFTTNNGVISSDAEMFELPRISIDYANKFKFGASLARGYVQYAN